MSVKLASRPVGTRLIIMAAVLALAGCSPPRARPAPPALLP